MTAQLKLSIIPEYADSRLYTEIVISKNCNWAADDYNNGKNLVFYNTTKASEHVTSNEIMSIKFPDFKTAYKFILDNNIKNYNIDSGSYKKEIKQYQKEVEQL